MYIPSWFQEERIDALHDLMRQFPFATLVSQAEEAPFATPLPFLLEAERGAFGVLKAHLARANPHWQAFDSETQAVVLFQGPHAYVSPTWYATQPSVPTWNYAVVHAYGVPRVLDDAALYATLQASLRQFEAEPLELSEEYLHKMMRGIVGIEIEITRLEGKFKLSQNRSAEDRIRVMEALARSDDPNARRTAEWMRRLENETEARL